MSVIFVAELLWTLLYKGSPCGLQGTFIIRTVEFHQMLFLNLLNLLYDFLPYIVAIVGSHLVLSVCLYRDWTQDLYTELHSNLFFIFETKSHFLAKLFNLVSTLWSPHLSLWVLECVPHAWLNLVDFWIKLSLQSWGKIPFIRLIFMIFVSMDLIL